MNLDEERKKKEVPTPQDVWKDFDDTLPLNAASELQEEDSFVRMEKVTFYGRDTGEGRVRIYAKYAYSASGAHPHTVLLLPDASRTVEDELMRLFVANGYNVLMLDYRGYHEGLLPAWDKPAPKIIRRLKVQEAPAEEPAEPVQEEIPAEQLPVAEDTPTAEPIPETETEAPAEELSEGAETEPSEEPAKEPSEAAADANGALISDITPETDAQASEAPATDTEESADTDQAEGTAASTEDTPAAEPAEDITQPQTDIQAEEKSADAETPESPVEDVRDTAEPSQDADAAAQNAATADDIPAEAPVTDETAPEQETPGSADTPAETEDAHTDEAPADEASVAEDAVPAEVAPVQEALAEDTESAEGTPADKTAVAEDAAEGPAEISEPVQDTPDNTFVQEAEESVPDADETPAPAEDAASADEHVQETETASQDAPVEDTAAVAEDTEAADTADAESPAEDTETAETADTETPAEELSEGTETEPSEEPSEAAEDANGALISDSTADTDTQQDETEATSKGAADSQLTLDESLLDLAGETAGEQAETTPAEGTGEDVQLEMDLGFMLEQTQPGDTEDHVLEEQLEEEHAPEQPAEPEKEPEPEYEEIIVEEPLPPHPGEYYTVYPRNVKYANYEDCKKNLCFADNGAKKTCWYEWVAAGLYARKYILERTGSDNIAVIGIREGGEVMWKMAAVRHFQCAVAICAAGWKSAAGKNKFDKPETASASAGLSAAEFAREEKKLTKEEKRAARDEIPDDSQKYFFVAGVDSQAYAPLVQCPVLLLCSVNDPRFDYDRAYDTYLRINPRYIRESGLSYAMNFNSFIDEDCMDNLYLYLNKYLKGHHVFLPRPVSVDISVDKQQDLIARVDADQEGVPSDFIVYYAEDTMNSVLRTWAKAEKVKGSKNEFYLNVFEGTKNLFVLGAARYTNGFMSWSKVTVKTISGRFRNMQHRSPLIYSSKLQSDGFISVGLEKHALGGIILQEPAEPRRIREDDVLGMYAPDGVQTYRISKPRYAPAPGSIMALDIFVEEDCDIYITITDLNTNEDFVFTDYLFGGLWQNLQLSAGTFKCGKKALDTFSREAMLTIRADGVYAVNNIMWL